MVPGTNNGHPTPPGASGRQVGGLGTAPGTGASVAVDASVIVEAGFVSFDGVSEILEVSEGAFTPGGVQEVPGAYAADHTKSPPSEQTWSFWPTW